MSLSSLLLICFLFSPIVSYIFFVFFLYPWTFRYRPGRSKRHNGDRHRHTDGPVDRHCSLDLRSYGRTVRASPGRRSRGCKPFDLSSKGSNYHIYHPGKMALSIAFSFTFFLFFIFFYFLFFCFLYFCQYQESGLRRACFGSSPCHLFSKSPLVWMICIKDPIPPNLERDIEPLSNVQSHRLRRFESWLYLLMAYQLHTRKRGSWRDAKRLHVGSGFQADMTARHP